ncbi:MAG: phosphonate ABC transporter, permease protein PhnE, partial [Thiobacillus sp.]|nr:phosphonate ABC transporter, permease protein PhnE [Thiobacillus sp.]
MTTLPATARYAQILASASRQSGRQMRLVACLVAVCLGALWLTGFFDLTRFVEGAPAVAQLASEMVPPDFSRWQSWLKPLLDTLAMSIAGTALAVLFSLPLALMAAPNTTPNAVVYRITRVFL